MQWEVCDVCNGWCVMCDVWCVMCVRLLGLHNHRLSLLLSYRVHGI